MMKTYPVSRLRRLSGSLAAALVLTLAASVVLAKPWWLRGTDTQEEDFLPPDAAFRLGASLVDGNQVHLRWVIADGYYLYKHKIEVEAESPDLVLGAPQLPQGALKTDPYLGRQEIYTRQVDAHVPYMRRDFGAHPVQLKITYQGCAEAGLCYPPITKVVFPVARASGIAESQTARAPAPLGWQLIAIFTGLATFLASGFALRRGRKLSSPDP